MRWIISLFLSVFFLALQAQTTVRFSVRDLPHEVDGTIGIRGSDLPLSWYKTTALRKVGDQYEAILSFADGIQKIEFKFVIDSGDDQVTWESSPNRILELTGKDQLESQNSWNVEQLIDVSALPKLMPDDLLKDYAFIEKMVLEVHPGTYRYNDKASILAALTELKASFQRPLSHGEAYLAMSKMTAQLQCDHTKPGFYNQQPLINSVIHRQRDKVPFAFQWIDDKMIVTHDATPEHNLTPGTEILRINGQKVQDIRQALWPYIGADGATDGNRLAKLAVSGYSFRFSAFDVFYGLQYPAAQDGFILEYKNFGTHKTHQVQAPAMTREERAQILEGRYPEFPKSRDDLWDFQITQDNIGMLTINSFALYGHKKLRLDYKSYLADVFKELKAKEVKHLILDIRQNNGGNDEMKDELFTYFPIEKNAKTFNRVGKTRYTQFPESLKPVVQSWGDNPWYFNLTPDGKEDVYYIFKEDMQGKAPKTKVNAFEGKVYLLTGAENVSLAFYLAADFKQKKLGKIYGEETGGNLRDVNGGQILFLRLPNSGIEIDFPVMGGFTLGEIPNQGVQPDVNIWTSQEDVAKGVDRVLVDVLAKIRE